MEFFLYKNTQNEKNGENGTTENYHNQKIT